MTLTPIESLKKDVKEFYFSQLRGLECFDMVLGDYNDMKLCINFIDENKMDRFTKFLNHMDTYPRESFMEMSEKYVK